MIKLISVDLGVKKVQIPIAEIKGDNGGKRLLITAGADGDEYAGIEAAYQLIQEFSKKKFRGYLTIIPILNIPGFEAGTSKNPLDNKFPKNVFPGKKNGSPSEKLINWLFENHIINSDVWSDLHGGATTEILDPYVYMYETNNKQLNEIITGIIKKINTPKIVFEKPGVWKKADFLAKSGKIYIITEAGCLGERSKIWRNKHLTWIKTIMGVLEMLDKYPSKNTFPRIYRKTKRYSTKNSGLWFPCFDRHKLISYGQKLGEVRSVDGSLLEEIIAKEDGEYLWMKGSLFCQKHDIVIEVGYEAKHYNTI